jgi:hypothetical protein
MIFHLRRPIILTILFPGLYGFETFFSTHHQMNIAIIKERIKNNG